MPVITTESLQKSLIMATEPASKQVSSDVKNLAYGDLGLDQPPFINQGSMFRLERGAPFQRNGRIVYATPQFKAMKIYSVSSSTAQLPTTTQTSVSITYPTKAK